MLVATYEVTDRKKKRKEKEKERIISVLGGCSNLPSELDSSTNAMKGVRLDR